MSHTQKELEELLQLAQEPSSDKRRALLRRITDVFLYDAESHSDSQSECFGDIMHKLAYDLEQQVREELSSRLAEEKNAPHHLIRALANDEIEVAKPVLEKSVVLTEDDLIEVSKKRDQEHLQAITVRPDIGENLSRELVKRGDDTTVEKLLRNENAKIASETVEEIAERAKKSEILQEPLIGRSEVTQNILEDLYSHVTDELKQKILAACEDIDESSIEPVLDTVASQLAQAKIETIEQLIEGLARKGALTENQLIKFLKDRKAMEFLLTLSHITGLDVQTTRRIIEDKSGKSLIILCKAHRMSPMTFKEIAMSSLTGIAEEPSKMLPLITIYNRFDTQNAQRVMRFWRTRKHTLEQEKEKAVSA